MFTNHVFFNPYQETTFTEFIVKFFYRLFLFITGQTPWSELATDEIQVLVLIGVAASASLVGTFLVLRRTTMLANALAHTVLIGIVIAYLASKSVAVSNHETFFVPMQALLIASVIMGFVTSFLTEFLTKTMKLQVDASTGLVFTTLFAIGVTLVTILTRSAHIGTEAVMGNADALHIDDLKWVYGILAFNICLTALFFRGFKVTTFDPGLAYALGFSNTFFNYLLMAQASATTIGAFRAVGVFLVLGFITGPVLSARLLTNHLKYLLYLSIVLGALASLTGVALTRHILTVYGIALSTSGMVVCMITCLYALTILLAPEKGVIARLRNRQKIFYQNEKRMHRL